YDDSLDVFGIHGVGGIVGALGTAVVAHPALGGFGEAGYALDAQLLIQLLAVLVAILWSGVVGFIAMMIVKALFGGARIAPAGESDGLDLTTHGERAYN